MGLILIGLVLVFCFGRSRKQEHDMIKEKLIEYLKSENVEGAFAVKNLSTGESYGFRENEVVPSASLIKVFILIRAFSLIKKGDISLADEIEVRQEDIVAFSVLEFLKPRKYQLEELLRLMIVYSDNTATNVLMDLFGIDAINEEIASIGYSDSVLQRKMMDFKAAEEGRQNYTSVKEMFDLMERLYTNSILGSPYDEQMVEIMKGQADETMMRQELPDEIVIARKSGELDALDHDIAIVYTDKCDYIYVFFTWDARDNNQARDVLSETSRMVFDDFINR